MGKKKKLQICMDFESSAVRNCAVLMGIAFFLRIVYYLGFTRPESLGFWNLLIFLILPMTVEAAFMILLRGIRYDAPALYAGMGAVYCLLLVFQSFQYGSILRTVLAVVLYLACGGALWACGNALLKAKIAAWSCILIAVGRFLFFDLGHYIFGLHLITFLPVAACILALLALGYLSHSMEITDNI